MRCSHLAHLLLEITWNGFGTGPGCYIVFCAFRAESHCANTFQCSSGSPGGFVKTQAAQPHCPSFWFSGSGTSLRTHVPILVTSSSQQVPVLLMLSIQDHILTSPALVQWPRWRGDFASQRPLGACLETFLVLTNGRGMLEASSG